jgi:4-amino-4-deoxy-L-arabinose transferase-like glycosyltransferase
MSEVSAAYRTRYILVALLITAAVFYFWRLGRADIVTDESSYATRAIRMVDFDFGIEQPTPWQWVDHVPWWMHLSFHDHPPFVFLLQHFSIKLFGENPTAIRIPSAIAGILAVACVYLIARRLYSPAVGLASAALFAFTVNHVWISRIGLQESILIALILAATLAFLAGLERSRWLLLAGIFLGLAFLAKYHALILIPIFITILAIRRRDMFQRKEFLFSIFLFLAIASPVIIYNVELYRNFGHFDFQFSLLLHQNVQEWQARPGQETLGSTSNRITHFMPWLIGSNSPYFLVIAAVGLAIIILEVISRKTPAPERPTGIGHWFLAVCFLWLFPFLIFIGPAYRFLTILTPWLAIAAGYGLIRIKERLQKPGSIYSNILENIGIGTRALPVALFVLLLAGEILYAYSSVIAVSTVGSKPWTYSDLRVQSQAWGFNELEAYLKEKLNGRMPEVAITFQFPFARTILNEMVDAGKQEGLRPVPWGIVYNDNINLSSQLWIFLRRILYGGWPVVSAENFRSGGAEKFFHDAGVKHIIFINAAPAALQDRARPRTPDGDLIEAILVAKGGRPREIKNPKGDITFRVYEFDIKE